VARAMTGRWGDDRCDGCGSSWHISRMGPVLVDDIWLSIADKQDTLCRQCVGERMQRVHGRPVQFSDLVICAFNGDYLDELGPDHLMRIFTPYERSIYWLGFEEAQRDRR
jgi:hypothetical protein